MAGQLQNTLGILPSLGGSIESQRRDRREGLFLKYYIPSYLKTFSQIHYFSYAKEKNVIDKNVQLIQNYLGVHKYLYAIFLPLVFCAAFRKCSLIRVMQANGALPAVIAKKIYGIPFVTTYGYNYVQFAEIQGHPWKAKLLSKLLPMYLKAADGIMVTTEDLRKEVESLIGRSEKVRIVPNGVDTNRFAPKVSEQNVDNGESLKLLFIGRFEKQKNLFFLMDVLHELKKLYPVQLTMIGTGSLTQKIEQMARQDRAPIHFVSRVPYEQMHEYHRHADCYISTSLAEGHPKALIEAMSSGLTCVVSDCPGNRTLIENEKNGIILPTENVNLWVEKVLLLARDKSERVRLGAAARETITDQFDIRTTLMRDCDFLKDLLNASRN